MLLYSGVKHDFKNLTVYPVEFTSKPVYFTLSWQCFPEFVSAVTDVMHETGSMALVKPSQPPYTSGNLDERGPNYARDWSMWQ
jgi:hypothetical protein